MAKMFYSLEEAAKRLGMSPEQVQGLVTSGQLQEFRDSGSGRLVFKCEQVDLLAGGGEGDLGASGSGIIPLSESGSVEGISLASDSGTGMPLESPKEQSGISIFEAENTESADPSAQTHVTAGPGGALGDAGGSGILGLTRDADDPSIDASDLLGGLGETRGETVGGSVLAGELFETTSAAGDAGAGLSLGSMMAAERFDPGWSGAAGALALGTLVVLGLGLVMTLGALSGSPPQALMDVVTGNWIVVLIALPLLVAVFTGAGAMIGRKSG
jgi:hypothetical protein